MNESHSSSWVEIRLGQLVKGYRGVSYRPEHLLDHAGKSAATLLRATNIQNGSITLDDVQYVPSWLVAPTQLLESGDIAVCMSNGTKSLVGKSAPYREDIGTYTVGAFCSIFKPIDRSNADFIFHLFRSQVYQKGIDLALAGSAINNLKNSSIENTIFEIPASKKEQRTIAVILNRMDDAIEKTESLIAKYQQIKAGLMHDLFTRGVTADGKLRPPREQAPELYQETPIGWISKEWRWSRCSEVCENICVGIVIRPTQYYVEAGVPTFRSANIREDGIDTSDLVFISDHSNAILSKSQVKAGDVLTVRTGYPGTSAVVPPEFDGSNCVDILISRPSNKIDSHFLCSWINSPFGKDQVLKGQGGLAQQHFNVGEMRGLVVAIPSQSEQQRIIEELRAISNRIHEEEALLEKEKMLKQGLMYDLLSGRVRVML